jgi:hypothetical protein
MTAFTKNFYSSIQQYSEIEFLAFDEGPRVYDRSTDIINSSSIDTSEIDQFRQGIEITQEKHTAGIYKISAGTAGHIIKPFSYGINNLDIISSKNFLEIDYFDPIEYIKAQEPGSTLSKVVTFPIITSDTNQQENYILNGIIEPLSIRPVASFYSIEFPFESHATRGTLMGGNADDFKFSSDSILTVDYVQTRLTKQKTVYYLNSTSSFEGNRSYENRSWYLDSSDSLLTGSSFNPNAEVPRLGTGYLNPDLNFNDPFNDSKSYFQSLGISVITHGEDMVNVFLTMTGSTDNYIPPSKKSATSGFVYDNIGSVGTDSIAFGGMTY